MTQMAIGATSAVVTMPEARSAPSQSQSTPLSKLKKIEMYATRLAGEGAAKEKESRFGDAIADYLQAADFFLLLAKNTPDYTPWKSLSDRAIACQQRVRILIAKRKLEEEKADREAPTPTSRAPA